MKNLGAFEAHENDVMLELWIEMINYYHKHNDKLDENRIFFTICDFLQDNQEHWLWEKIFGNTDTEETIKKNIQLLSKKLVEFQYVIYKPIYNKFGEMVGYDKKNLKSDKYFHTKWKEDKTYTTSNGILVRFSSKGHISLKGITPNGIIMSQKDFKLFCNQTKLEIDTITPPQLERLIIDIKNTLDNEYWKQYPTMKIFKESFLTQNGIKINRNEIKKDKYVIGSGFVNSKKVDIDVKSIKTEMSVFDLSDTFLN